MLKITQFSERKELPGLLPSLPLVNSTPDTGILHNKAMEIIDALDQILVAKAILEIIEHFP